MTAGGWTYPHPPVADGRPVVRQPQDEQIHLVLPPAADAKTEALDAFLQLHREEVEVLGQLGQQNPPPHHHRSDGAELSKEGTKAKRVIAVASGGKETKHVSIP